MLRVVESPRTTPIPNPGTELEGPVSSGPAPIGTAPADSPEAPHVSAANTSPTHDATPNGDDAEGPASAPRAKQTDDVAIESAPESEEPPPEPPPADPTEIPADRPSMMRDDAHALETPAKPVLASEALMDDLAPVDPSSGSARVWCAAVGLGFAALGVLPLVGLRPGGALTAGLSFFLGGVSLVAALAKVTYRQRAFAMLMLGLIVVITGLGGTGPAAFIAQDAPGLGLARAFAATALPGALLFRARYRAYAGARWLLGGAFVLSLPFAVLLAIRLVTREPDLSMAGSIVALVVTLAGLAGFMGKETTGAGTYVGLSVLLGLGTELCLSDLNHPGEIKMLPIIMTVLGSSAFVAATGLSALGLFQLLASRLSGEARRIDLHAAAPETRPRHANKSEWSV